MSNLHVLIQRIDSIEDNNTSRRLIYISRISDIGTALPVFKQTLAKLTFI